MEPTDFFLAINTRWWNAEAHYAFNLALALTQAGHQVTVLANAASPVAQRAAQAGLAVWTELDLDNNRPWVQWGNYRKLRARLSQGRLPVVVSFKSSGSWIFSLARKRWPGLVLVRVRGEARRPKTNGLNRWAYGPQGCNGVLGAGSQIADWIRELVGPEQKVGVLYYGAPPLASRPAGGRDQSPAPLELPQGKTVYCLLGRTQAVKGHQICLEAFALLAEPESHLLLLVKDLEEYPLELQNIKEKITSLGLDSQVTVVGQRSDLFEILQSVQVGVIPSLGSEVNCRVLVEFFSLSIPVVAFGVGTLPQLVDSGRNGWLCPTISAEALAEGLKQAGAQYPAWGKEAGADYRAKYRLEVFGARFLDFFAQLGTR
ncbi:MAG: hypothetical protein A2600_00085 [Candidatus Lambdaproteobacteria bacterium RIFOXYD1_FULL_56_27]|uniref:Glycosyltransferase subfamily 4-like N-terminal domain-containing protein n=1 Tax=Candidatus Lambdaproteobacteria bacterium RIFOXYD2_FULL_56_26 TaxID=1817773 RepID=A0A1F6GPG1_9PROT|nr:MAG: hypothetical protein A2557_04205 [Candidatus Lambdaproteobacteria bacterium RIFOXYD2_FULL_56_26]OGH03917.1 MAG: hypothetical protein A2426_07430 [Candidatus Lambdaproteobacteria bacterium RIFOXYC1_FULL_56_13]OGH06174.1 MAG: hypothetical protein A2600_00085 [Candidatus Lambdaproteobacteria bacterium RIFOXYD1_FULL_56_27]